jgi:hypothetical protein
MKLGLRGSAAAMARRPSVGGPLGRLDGGPRPDRHWPSFQVSFTSYGLDGGPRPRPAMARSSHRREERSVGKSFWLPVGTLRPPTWPPSDHKLVKERMAHVCLVFPTLSESERHTRFNIKFTCVVKP